MLRLSIASALLLVLSVPASADWTQAQRNHFLGQCVESCQDTLKLPDSKRKICDATCGCVADQAQTTGHAGRHVCDRRGRRRRPHHRDDAEDPRLLPQLR